MKEFTPLLDTPYYRAIAGNGIRLPAVLQLIRKDATRIEKPTDGTMWRKMFLTPRPDGCANTITTGGNDNYIMLWIQDFKEAETRKNGTPPPPRIIQSLGNFDLDPCAPSLNFYTASQCYKKEMDGLLLPWHGRVWLNPPYKNPLIGKFIDRMATHSNGIALVFNRMDTALWHDKIFPSASAMLVMRGRVRFFHPDGTEGDSAGCGSVLIAWGKKNAAVLKDCGIAGKFINL